MLQLATIFFTVFLAELGDKTQIATFLIAAEGRHHPIVVFIAAGGALVASTALAIFLGAVAGNFLNAFPVKLIAGIGFIVLGIWSVIGHFTGA